MFLIELVNIVLNEIQILFLRYYILRLLMTFKIINNFFVSFMDLNNKRTKIICIYTFGQKLLKKF